MQNLFHTFPGRRALGNVLEQHDKHEDSVQKLCCIGNCRHNRTRCCRTFSNFKGTCQQNPCDNKVHKCIDHRIHKRKNNECFQLCFYQRIIGFSKPLLFIKLADTRLNHANSRDVLLHNRVDLVQLILQL